jgi:hypothetical protein
MTNYRAALLSHLAVVLSLLASGCGGGPSSSGGSLTSFSCYDPQTQTCFVFSGSSSFAQQCELELCPSTLQVSSCGSAHSGTPVSTCTNAAEAAVANCPAGSQNTSYFVAPSSVGDNNAKQACEAKSGVWSGPT